MKFHANKDVLAAAVIFVTKLIPAKTTTPVLSGVRIDATAEGVQLASFDQTVSTRTTIDADVSEPGSVLVTGRTLAEIVTKLPGDTVSLTFSESKLLISSGTSKFTLSTMSLSEYPNLPEVPDPIGTIDGELFAEAVSQVGVAYPKEDGKPEIQNIHLGISSSTLSFTATDRYRIADRDVTWKAASGVEDQQILIPSPVLIEAGKLFQTSESVTICLRAGGDREIIAFVSGNRIVTSALAKGAPLRMRAIFDERGTGSSYAIVLASDLVEATRRVNIVVTHTPSVRYTFSADGVLLETSLTETSSATETLDAHLVGEPVVVGLKPKYLLDGVLGARSEFVRIGFIPGNDSNKPGPILITAHSGKDSDTINSEYRYLMQPNLFNR